MSEDGDLKDLHERVLRMSTSHRDFVLPILRALERLGGSAKVKLVVEEVRSLLPEISPPVFQELHARGRFGWTRYELHELGILGGEPGIWTLTELGKRYTRFRAADPLETPDVKLARGARNKPSVKTENVVVTGFPAFEIPALDALAAGKSKTKDILDAIGLQLKDKLTPGDRRSIPSGSIVWRFRASWALSTLRKGGYAVNPQGGIWHITESGLQRLSGEKPGWDIKSFPAATATVTDATATPPPPIAPPPPPGSGNGEPPRGDLFARWEVLREELASEVFDALDARLCPLRGPSPDIATMRNVIFYGPPGTGKTHVAKHVARALTGDDEEAGERLRLVQFHPSYTYEDFVQGMRPDLTKTELRYGLERGPFLRIVDGAVADPTTFFVLIIDEINRGDPARIFGELLYALEYREEPVSLALGGELSVPANLVIIGTMNSVDRSVALVDYALRRRFAFLRIEPDHGVIGEVHGDTLLGNAGAVILKEMNAYLTQKLDREHALGHSIFLSRTYDPGSAQTFDRIWSLDICPLLEEYFFGDRDALAEATTRWRSIVDAAVKNASDLAES